MVTLFLDSLYCLWSKILCYFTLVMKKVNSSITFHIIQKCYHIRFIFYYWVTVKSYSTSLDMYRWKSWRVYRFPSLSYVISPWHYFVSVKIMCMHDHLTCCNIYMHSYLGAVSRLKYLCSCTLRSMSYNMLSFEFCATHKLESGNNQP
jgi:hypothetical protein